MLLLLQSKESEMGQDSGTVTIVMSSRIPAFKGELLIFCRREKNREIIYRKSIKDYSLPAMPKGPNLLLVKLSKILLIYWKEDQSLV